MDIFIDWGSTNFHAFLVDAGKVVARHEVAGQGFLAAFVQTAASRSANCSAFLAEAVGPWLERYPGAPVLMCGAVGSREGWVETRYVEVPGGIAEVAAGVVHFDREQCGCLAGRPIAVTAGMAITHADGRHDVMRSEEVKALGAAASLGRDSALLAIPGTHCKWIRVEAGRIVDFYTAMTGDFFGILSGHGSLAPLFATALDKAGLEARSFGQGLELAAQGADLLFDVWQVRSRILHAPDPPAGPRSMLSGILIGHEVRQACAFRPGASDVVLVTDPGQRADCYRRACEAFGLSVSATVASEAAVHAGLAAIRKALA